MHQTVLPEHIPLSLYLHMPWCIQKCPYCDFNSHTLKGPLPRQAYKKRLIEEWREYYRTFGDRRPLVSIFFGGGTPSLFEAEDLSEILEAIGQDVPIAGIEITLEANPGTTDSDRFRGYRRAGVNRLSLGVQSFSSTALQRLGRIHDGQQAEEAIVAAREAGFDQINLDLMYGLPEQTLQESLEDLEKACDFQTDHLSWYQLTLEPNTVFYRYPPQLPDSDILEAMNDQGLAYLSEQGFSRYEISAFARDEKFRCQHNLNYWTYGDYLGVGAGAHSKITRQGNMIRFQNIKEPSHYMRSQSSLSPKLSLLSIRDRIFEYMLNHLRLCHPLSLSACLNYTGVDLQNDPYFLSILENLSERSLLVWQNEDTFQLSDLGFRFYNEVVGYFLPEPNVVDSSKE